MYLVYVQGDWITLKSPNKFALAYMHIYARTCCRNRAPLDYRVYGSNNDGASWDLVLDVTGATYGSTSFVHVSPRATLPALEYNMYGLVVSKIVEAGTLRGSVTALNGQTDTMLQMNIVQLQLYTAADDPPTQCTSCPAGLTSTAGSASCSACPAGTFSQPSMGSTCSPCPAGTWSGTAGTAACTYCPLGTFLNTTGAISDTACMQCPPGTFGNATGLTRCFACSSGRYAASAGATSCSLCPKGTSTNKV